MLLVWLLVPLTACLWALPLQEGWKCRLQRRSSQQQQQRPPAKRPLTLSRTRPVSPLQPVRLCDACPSARPAMPTMWLCPPSMYTNTPPSNPLRWQKATYTRALAWTNKSAPRGHGLTNTPFLLPSGSWVLIYNPDGLPIVGQIEQAYQSQHHDGEWHLTITRFLRAEETWHGPSKTFWPNEVFKTNLTSTHSIRQVIAPAFAMSPSQFRIGTPKQPIWSPQVCLTS